MSDRESIMYKCEACNVKGVKCEIKISNIMNPPTTCPVGGDGRATWKLQHPDPTTPLIIWEDPGVDAVAAVR